MYVRLNRFTAAPGTREAVERLIVQFKPRLRTVRGCRGVAFFGDDATGEYGSFTLWETREAAEAADAALAPQFRQAAAAAGLRFQEAPGQRIFGNIDTFEIWW